MIRAAVVLSCFALLTAEAAAAPARAAAARPPQVFGELLSAPLDHELGALGAALGGLGVPAKIPARGEALAGIGKLLGFPIPDGVDAGRAMAAVLVDPRGKPRPLVLVVQVADEHRFASATQNLPAGIAVKRRQHTAALGDPEVLALVGDYALGRLREAPKDGLRVRVFVGPLWAAFGSSAPLVRVMIGAQASAPPAAGSKSPPAIAPETLLKLFDGAVSAVQQLNELALDLRSGGDGIEFSIHLIALPGTAIDGFIAGQRPSDFSGLAKLADLPTSYVGAGHIDLTVAPTLGELIFGEPSDAPSRDALAHWLRLASGEIAMTNHWTSPRAIDVGYVMRMPEADPPRAVIEQAMAMNALGRVAKMTRTALPPSSYDGLAIDNDRIDVDVSALPHAPGQEHVKNARAWTVWGDTLACAVGPRAADDVKALIDAARHGKQLWQPTPEQRRSLDAAKAAKESFWVSVDPHGFDAILGKTMPIRLGQSTVTFGFHGHDVRMRFLLSTPGH